VNDGTRQIIALQLSAGSEVSLITQFWSVSQLPNGNFELPSYAPTINIAATASFGYIANSAQPIIFQTAVLSCY